MNVRTRLLMLVAALAGCVPSFAAPTADASFDVTVKQKTYAHERPLVVIDEAHQNLNTATGTYKPLADLLTNDGYDVRAGTDTFQPQTLRAVRVLIVADARGKGATDATSPAAFTDAECDIVADWVGGGGSLLLVADHTPFAAAASELSKRFGVSMGKGLAFDPASFETTPTDVVFSGAQLGDHPIVRGRNSAERIKRVVAFGGQSLSIPGIGVAVLKFGPSAYEAENQSELTLALDEARKQGSAPRAIRHATPTAGRALAVALVLGRGRVVVLGDADMLTAQISDAASDGAGPSGASRPIGMNVPGNDDKQFALNILHWLSAAL